MKQEQVYALKIGDELHHGECVKTVGVRGGETLKQEFWRVNGQLKLWKTRPNEFELPLRHGLYNYGYLNQWNVGDFHLPSECQPTIVHKQPLPSSENSKDKSLYKVTLKMICGGRRIRGHLERLLVSPHWLSNGHWMILRSRIASKLLREGSWEALQARFLKYADVTPMEDEDLERVVPKETKYKADYVENRTKTFEDGKELRTFKVFRYGARGEKVVGFNALYIPDNVDVLFGNSDDKPWITEARDLIIMPHKLG